MTRKERVLYHQIHPLKLATDIAASVISLYLLWQQMLGAGLLVHFIPPIVASALLLRYGDFDKQAQSSFGRYVARHMTRTIEAIRFFGDLVTLLGAWQHDVLLIVLGFAVVIGAWCNGLLPSAKRVTSR
jgi:hypothetical protein